MQYIDCNINPISRVVSYPGATIVQRDTNVEALRFHFSLDAEYELENDSIRIMVLKDGKTNGFNAENVRVETNDGGDEELVFEHTITTHETATPGQIAISVCGNQVSGNNITEAWHTLNMVFQVSSAAHSESDEGEDTPETIASNAEKIAALQTLVNAITSGRPIPVDLKSKMTDTSAIYLYTGTETGEQHNYWYYHDGTSWVPGSEYGGMTIDDELSSTSENAVQNKVIKANFDEINGRLHDLDEELGLNPKIEASVTTGDANVKVTLLDGIDLDLATPYVFTFRIPEAIATDMYIPIYRDAENLLITLTLTRGTTEKVWNYTTHATVPFADGIVQVKTNTANVHVDMTIEYATAPPSRIDNIETAVEENTSDIDALETRVESTEEITNFLDVSVNKLNPERLTRGKYISKAGAVGTNSILSYTGFIAVKPGDRVNVVNDGVCDSNSVFRICTAYDSTRTAIESAGKESSWTYDVPDGVMFVVLSLYNTDIDGGKLAVNVNEIPAYSEYGATPSDTTFNEKISKDLGLDVVKNKVDGIDVSVNRLNPFTVTVGRSMLKDGTTSRDTTMVYTDFISVKPGDRVNIAYNGVCDSNTTFRVCTAFDAQKNVVEASGRESSWAYNVPDGIYFIVLTIKKTYFESGLLAVNINGVFPYSAYNDVAANMNYLSRLIQQPYTTLPSYILDNAWYRPLGPLEKGYFCFMTDDGRMGLTEYTIPMVLDKGIKCSFALMSSSEVMQNQSDIDIVLNAISHGCEVAQHGGNRWTTYSEYGLNKYFDDEKAFFDSVGIDLHGAVIPESYNSKLIFALAGARFGVLRGGGDGHEFPLGPWYQYRTAGARSNLYGLSGYNVIDQSLATSKAAVDYAIANNKIMIVYTHENELGTSQKATLEGLLDYVNETGITQVTLGDIPNLI